MKLYEAKMKARQEMKDLLAEHNVTVEQVKAYVAKHPKYAGAMQNVPHHHGISTAANFIADLAGKAK